MLLNQSHEQAVSTNEDFLTIFLVPGNTENEPSTVNSVLFMPCLLYAKRKTQKCIFPEPWPEIISICIFDMYVPPSMSLVGFNIVILPRPFQASQIALLASSFSLSAFLASSLTMSLLFRSFSLTARSYAFPSSVFFGGFTPSAPAIKRPAAADDFSCLFSEPLGDRSVPLDELEVSALAEVDQSVLSLREWEYVGDIGVGGGGPGVASVGVEGCEGVEEIGEAASSQVSATALVGLSLADDEMVSFLREDSSP